MAATVRLRIMHWFVLLCGCVRTALSRIGCQGGGAEFAWSSNRGTPVKWKSGGVPIESLRKWSTRLERCEKEERVMRKGRLQRARTHSAHKEWANRREDSRCQAEEVQEKGKEEERTTRDDDNQELQTEEGRWEEGGGRDGDAKRGSSGGRRE